MVDMRDIELKILTPWFQLGERRIPFTSYVVGTFSTVLNGIQTNNGKFLYVERFVLKDLNLRLVGVAAQANQIIAKQPSVLTSKSDVVVFPLRKL